MLVFPQMDPTNSHGSLFGKFDLRGDPGIQNGDKTTKTRGGRNSNTGPVGFKDLQEALPWATSTL